MGSRNRNAETSVLYASFMTCAGRVSNCTLSTVGGLGRKGRKLAHALYRISGRHRTHRAGAGNNWISAFEEDVKAYCFTSLSRKLPSRGSSGSSTHTGKL